MDSQATGDIDRLFSSLCRAYHRGRPGKAARLAERLALLLEEPSAENCYVYSQYWVLIHAARGDHDKALGIQLADIERYRGRLESGWYVDSPEVIREEVELLQHHYYFLALNLLDNFSDPVRAKEALVSGIELADRFGVEMDDDLRNLLGRL